MAIERKSADRKYLSIKNRCAKKSACRHTIKVKTARQFFTPTNKQIIESDTATSKLIVLYSIMKTDRLFYEFMNEVIREKIHAGYETDKSGFFGFFGNKRQQSETVASWKGCTFYKLRQVYIRILFEAGLLRNQKEPRELMVGMMNMKVKEHLLQLGEHQYVEILTGDRR